MQGPPFRGNPPQLRRWWSWWRRLCSNSACSPAYIEPHVMVLSITATIKQTSTACFTQPPVHHASVPVWPETKIEQGTQTRRANHQLPSIWVKLRSSDRQQSHATARRRSGGGSRASDMGMDCVRSFLDMQLLLSNQRPHTTLGSSLAPSFIGKIAYPPSSLAYRCLAKIVATTLKSVRPRQKRVLYSSCCDGATHKRLSK